MSLDEHLSEHQWNELRSITNPDFRRATEELIEQMREPLQTATEPLKVLGVLDESYAKLDRVSGSMRWSSEADRKNDVGKASSLITQLVRKKSTELVNR